MNNLDTLVTGGMLRIPREFVRSTLSKATVLNMFCHVPLVSEGDGQSLQVGAPVSEGAVIQVPAGCHVSLLLEDSSIIRLPSNAALKIMALRKYALEDAIEVRLDLTQGRVELEVNKRQGKSAPFEVRTPLSVMGVRGTEFRVGYSAADKTAQVEVLDGIVATQGSADLKPLVLTKGLGLPIDGQGKAQAVEKLLAPPEIASAEVAPERSAGFIIRLRPIAAAKSYVVDETQTANLTSTRRAQNLQAPQLLISELSPHASFYRLSAVSASGLIGVPKSYAFCLAGVNSVNTHCSALFDVPLANDALISFALIRTGVDGRASQTIRTDTLKAHQGQIQIRGLQPGHYNWQLSYSTQPDTRSRRYDVVHRESGSFELIALPPH